MTKLLTKGEKIKIQDLDLESQFTIGVKCGHDGLTPNIACFGVDSNGKLPEGSYLISRSPQSSPDGSITMVKQNGKYSALFSIDLTKLPSSIVRLIFTIAIEHDTPLSQLSSGHFDVISGQTVRASFVFNGSDFSTEKAAIIGEIYLKTVWRMSAVAQGFRDGMSALLAQFDGEKFAANLNFRPIVEVPIGKPTKVRLDKQGEQHRVSLAKETGSQIFHINLQWDEGSSGGFWGSLFGSKKGVDLDLGCMWMGKNGSKGVIQPLGNNFGSRNGEPYISLDKDDRTGTSADGENMHIYRPEQMAVVLIFAMIYEGTANFRDVNGRLTITDGKGGEITVPLNTPDPSRTFCAVALITNDGKAIQIQKEERYFSGHKECDDFYGFGFRWVAGKK